MFWSVTAPSNPPNVIIGDKQAKYMKSIDERHWKLNASLTSLHAQGAFRLISSISPPQNLNWDNEIWFFYLQPINNKQLPSCELQSRICLMRMYFLIALIQWAVEFVSFGNMLQAFLLEGYFVWRVKSYVGIPFTWRQHGHLVKELIKRLINIFRFIEIFD